MSHGEREIETEEERNPRKGETVGNTERDRKWQNEKRSEWEAKRGRRERGEGDRERQREVIKKMKNRMKREKSECWREG